MTVAELKAGIDDLISKGAIAPDTTVLVSDDRTRNEAFDPIECFESVPSGPGEYDEKRISPAKYAKLKTEGKDVRLETSGMFAAPLLEVVGGFNFAGDDAGRKKCLVVMNKASLF